MRLCYSMINGKKVSERTGGWLITISSVPSDATITILKTSGRQIIQSPCTVMTVLLNPNMVGDLHNYPKPVYFDPNGISNILSMAEVLELCQVNFNSKENKFIIHLTSRRPIDFFRSSEGLFYHDHTAKGGNNAE